MKRLVFAFLIGTMGVLLLASAGDSQESKGGKGYTPFGWAFLKLTVEQKAKLGKIHNEFKGKIKELEDKVKGIKDEEHGELLKILTTEQKKLLQTKAGAEIKTDEKKKAEDKK